MSCDLLSREHDQKPESMTKMLRIGWNFGVEVLKYITFQMTSLIWSFGAFLSKSNTLELWVLSRKWLYSPGRWWWERRGVRSWWGHRDGSIRPRTHGLLRWHPPECSLPFSLQPLLFWRWRSVWSGEVSGRLGDKVIRWEIKGQADRNREESVLDLGTKLWCTSRLETSRNVRFKDTTDHANRME